MIRTDSFVVKKNEIEKIGGQLTVFATKGILIEGTLYLYPGASFRMFSPTVTWDGDLVAVFPNPDFNPKNDVISACTLNISGSFGLQPGDSLHLTAGAFGNLPSPCNTHIYGAVRLPAGANGSLAPPSHPDGQDGGNIRIGLDAPEAERIATSEHEKWKADQPYSVTISGGLNSGAGGDGAPKVKPQIAGTTQTYTPGNGGLGGNISILTDRYSGPGSLIAGAGGDGGLLSESTVPNGTAGQPNAGNVVINQGSGGEGGGVSVVASESSRDENFVAGIGGDPSYFDLISAGNGYYSTGPAYSSAGTGGNLTLKLGTVGEAGHGTSANHYPPPDGRYSAVSINGGNGGSASPDQPFAAPGFDGGSFTLLTPKGSTVAQLAKQGVSLTLSAFGEGGGANGICGAPGPNGPNAGNLHDMGFRALFIVNPGGIQSFNGGFGGNGNPPGAGGLQGKDDEGGLLGNPGVAGMMC